MFFFNFAIKYFGSYHKCARDSREILFVAINKAFLCNKIDYIF